MEKGTGSDTSEAGNAPERILQGGITLSEDRLRALAPQWAPIYQSLRQMDEISLGEIEPATLFVWRDETP